jgi:phage antirepressor YoqD-like protein
MLSAIIRISARELRKFVRQQKRVYRMKGVSYITDEKNQKKAVVIDLKTIEQKHDDVHEFIDVLVAESRKGGETIAWEQAKRLLKKKGKL